ncbi:MAG: hypothetical protein KDE22_10485 [Rhodobacterales bacterium]|nr:hypothetical protein [Rhodobacterales bacterium]
MNETLTRIMAMIPAMWRRRWLMLATAWVVCLLGWAVVAFLPDKYESSARVYVDTDSLLRPLLRGLAVETDTMRQIDVMQRTLVSRPNLEKVARMTDLDLSVTTIAETEELLNRLRSDIKVQSQRNNLFAISYRHSDPQMAQKVVQALLTIFVEGNLGTNRKEMDTARQFIDEQVRIYEEQMNQAEGRLAAFKTANMGLLPGESGGYYGKLTSVRAELSSMEAQLADSVNRGAELQRQLAEVPEYNEIEAESFAGPPSNYEVRILELEQNIDNLLLHYTPKHPDVIAAQTRLDDLKKKMAEEEGEGGPPGAGPGPKTERVPNELYQSIKLQLINERANAATLRGKVERAKQGLAQLQEQANRIPEVEAELARLTRDYGVIRENYEKLLARKESAIISESRETKGEKVQFRIIEPPQVPVLPTGITRSIFLIGVLVGGLAAGVGIGVLVVSMQTTFYSVIRLGAATGQTVLGNVSMVRLPGKRSFRAFRLVSFTAAAVALFAVFGGLVVIERDTGLPNAVPKEVRQKIFDLLPAQISSKLH